MWILFIISAFGQESVRVETFEFAKVRDGQLLVNVYFPAQSMRYNPVFLYAHGGGFVVGSRDDDFIVEYMRYLAKKRIVAVSMNYTLWMKGKGFGCDVPASEKIKTFLKSGREVNMATAFLLEKSHQLAIDIDRIILAGSSAGAEAVLHAAFWDSTRFDQAGEVILSGDFRYAGLINMAGALHDINFISAKNSISILSYHGTCDPLVPYGKASHHYCKKSDPGFLMLSGSESIYKRASKYEVSNVLFSSCDGGHEWAEKPIKENDRLIIGFIEKLSDVGESHWVESIGGCELLETFPCVN